MPDRRISAARHYVDAIGGPRYGARLGGDDSAQCFVTVPSARSSRNHYSLRGGKRICVELALAVADLEESGVAPARAPGVLTDPALVGFGIADDLDAMSADVRAGDMVIHAAAVSVEVVVDVERRRARTYVAQIILAVGDVAQTAARCDRDCRCGPVRHVGAMCNPHVRGRISLWRIVERCHVREQRIGDHAASLDLLQA